MSEQQKEYLDRCVDALDHIMRMARASRVTSKRLSWIGNRAESAINGNEDWRSAPLPVNGESQLLRARLRIQELEAQIAAKNEVPAQLHEMNEDLLAILGKPNFVCGPIAHLMKAAGVVDMRPKSEDEQAHVLLWLLRLYLEHGYAWANVASLEISNWQKLLSAKRSEVANG